MILRAENKEQKKEKEEEEEKYNSATQVVVVLGSSIVGNAGSGPLLAEHRKKHQW
jgi:hypothetical protein